ncbi:DUF6262 family protein [Nocardia shimofusensis]|uniref:DUF6262 family protein n=1 Tax=Nocardia shimofusensis TaxID=228596 RepID=UPI000A03C262|nr:DUF6262 family protein [Nocardia shimofusensis]
MPPADNTRYLLEATRRRHEDARRRTKAAITSAARRNDGTATVAGIARTAGVSRSWIYTQPDLVGAIDTLRPRNTGPRYQGRASEESLRTRLEAADKRNKQLRQQITQLTERLEIAYGEIRALRTAQRP